VTFGFVHSRRLARRALLSYNAEMGTSNESGPATEQDLQIDLWLRDGGMVVAASERARRALTARYHRARRAEGLSAWPSPAILDWHTFLRNAWEEQTPSLADDRLLLNAVQEKSIWVKFVGSEQRLATLLSGPRNRVAALSMHAHQLLCSHAPKYLRSAERRSWLQDAGIFSGWLEEFERACADGKLLSSARLPLELIERLEREPDSVSRLPLLLAGFDRILPVQRTLLDAWGSWEQARHNSTANEIRYYRASDSHSELAACALWCRQRLDADPAAKLLIISQELSQQRGEIERTFLALASSPGAPPAFEFSLGIPLSEVALAHCAYLLLRWLSNPINENEVDWLFSCGLAAADEQESAALQNYMRTLRKRELERPQWSLQAFLNQKMKSTLPSNWVSRISDAQLRFAEQVRGLKSPLEWAEIVPNLLQVIGWPGTRALSSEEFQVIRRWESALESCASLGFDGGRIAWNEFLVTLKDTLEETLFAPETQDAPIQIAGPAESAGLTADAIWFMGASESVWPSSGTTHAFLPLEIQRQAEMPHATSQLDWELSDNIVARLLSSACEVCFSYARQGDDAEERASRMIVRVAGTPTALPAELIAPAAPPPLTVPFEDFSMTVFRLGRIAGGTSVLTYQSQCPFKAFASARLGAHSWNPAEPCLTAAQRGQLVHAVLHSIWGGTKTGGRRTLDELRAIADRDAFIAEHVRRATQSELEQAVRERLPQRYLEMEERRLNFLVGEWLGYEMTRVDFTVLETEAKRTVELDGLSFDLRLDRIDQLADDTLLVIDYKTGAVTPKSWQLPRPDDVQLPLYASFALGAKETLGGVTFAKVRRGEELGFAGHMTDARATLISSLHSANGLTKKKLDEQTMRDWKREIENLVRSFVAGRADVAPREYPETCTRCGLHALCRIQENRVLLAVEDEALGEEAVDE
jgi:ATP-dependent helicase/nuclease subunit B